MDEDRAAKCPKCGNIDIPYMTWVAPHMIEQKKGKTFNGECLVLECPTCGYPTSIPVLNV